MYTIVVFQKERKYIEDFLAFPQKIYKKHEMTQNIEEERKIAEETHVLNKYFKQIKILAYHYCGEVCGRCIVTIYPGTSFAYVGYFECIEEGECAKALFCKVDSCAREHGLQSVIGPLDSSFWLKYRLKVNHFNKPPYFGEPYNKPYYEKLFEDNGYRAIESWVSNLYAKPPLFSRIKNLYKDRLLLAESKQYTIVSASPKEFAKTLDIIYRLISETFKDFMAFHPITIEDFREICKNYRYILDYRLVKIVYYNHKPVAFSITLPDYQNLLYRKLTLWCKLQILLKRLRSGNYVSLYMGSKKEHNGLGKALTQKIIQALYIRRASCIGALIANGKITERFAKELIQSKNSYVLYEKKLS